MSLSYSQCLIFLGSREDEKTRPPSKPNPRRVQGLRASEEAKALRAFTRTATVFAAAGIRSNPSLSANPTYAVHSPAFSGGYSREAAEQG
ncbi:hypothetical protein glysoja_023733 [Glycine soja]|nr:hypothetical protein glysoja_023733 [Glycine soja]